MWALKNDREAEPYECRTWGTFLCCPTIVRKFGRGFRCLLAACFQEKRNRFFRKIYARVYKNFPLWVYRILLRFSFKRLIFLCYPASRHPSHRYCRRTPVPPAAALLMVLPWQLNKSIAFLRFGSCAPESDPPFGQNTRLKNRFPRWVQISLRPA